MKQSIKTIILSTICKCLHFLFLPFLDGYVNRRTFYAFPYKINDDIQYLLTDSPMTSSKLRHSRGAVYCIIQYLVYPQKDAWGLVYIFLAVVEKRTSENRKLNHLFAFMVRNWQQVQSCWGQNKWNICLRMYDIVETEENKTIHQPRLLCLVWMEKMRRVLY